MMSFSDVDTSSTRKTAPKFPLPMFFSSRKAIVEGQEMTKDEERGFGLFNAFFTTNCSYKGYPEPNSPTGGISVSI